MEGLCRPVFLANHLGFAEIIAASESFFGIEFNQKLFRSQLSYFDDIDYSEAIEYLIDDPPTDEQIKSKLVQWVTK